jgi:hypothetical protein
VASELLLKQKCETMIAYAYVALRQFPKHEKHVLGAEIRAALWQIVRLVIVCHKRYHKKTSLLELDVEVELLRSLVRVAKDLGYLDFKKYEHWARLNDEIGRMLGGWVKGHETPLDEKG